MSATLSTIMPGVPMQTSNIKCICGEHPILTHKAKLGRLGDKLVTVFNVPVYVCEGCEESFMNGADSKIFATRVKTAVELNLDSVTF
ncbi:YgiT-type zinc finger protein [Paenibacillus sp. FSL K6-1122]|uniref:YgiT-type zinc finger protein n=1 Tax=unclassified Paenibacillus TaxID=185978 RepID=UPI0028F5D8D4|nr:YgiT-type zinc finger protein [Paenibacillus sp. ClWae2A]MDT9720789.1 YgiT-type zinc finger protein [Paenibacillus sp. ClWae2A]